METPKDYVKEFNEIMDKVDISEKPKLVRFTYGKRYFSKKFIDIDLIPHIDITFDGQMEKGWRNENEIQFYGYKEYSISLNWLGLSVGIAISILTDKWEDE